MPQHVRRALAAWAGQRRGGSACLLGLNGSGKSFAVQHLPGTLVSFEATLSFLEQYGTKDVASVCGGIHSAKARSLVVRFGLINCWTKRVDALSSGELRKLTLARAMADSPGLLILDGAHDGLDPLSRQQLRRLLTTLVKGLPRLLVDLGGTGDSKATDRMKARILQVVHRAEELPSNLTTVFATGLESSSKAVEEKTGEDPVQVLEEISSKPSLFLAPTIARLFAEDQEPLGSYPASYIESKRGKGGHVDDSSEPIAEIRGAQVVFSRTDRDGSATGQSGLKGVDWKLRKGETWAICGHNGAGKTLLTKLIASPTLLQDEVPLASIVAGETGSQLSFDVNNERTAVSVFGLPKGSPEAHQKVQERVGTVSIVGHMGAIFAAKSAQGSSNEVIVSAAHVIASGLRGASAWGQHSLICDTSYESMTEGHKERVSRACATLGLDFDWCQGKSFLELSLGEQRMVLMARAIVHAPQLLVFDEVCQGLDVHCRNRVNDLICAVQEASDVATVFVTHHADEVPHGVTHLLELSDGVVSSRSGRVASAQVVRDLILSGYEGSK